MIVSCYDTGQQNKLFPGFSPSQKAQKRNLPARNVMAFSSRPLRRAKLGLGVHSAKDGSDELVLILTCRWRAGLS